MKLALISVLMSVALQSVAAAQSMDFARGKCVEVGFKEKSAGHDDCVKQYLKSAGSGLAPPPSMAAPRPQVSVPPMATKPVPPASSPEVAATQREEKFWDGARAAGNKAAFETYLVRYPNGRYAGLANANIERASAVSALPAASQASNRAPAGTVFKDCADCPEMVVIPAGRFVMGAVPGEEEREVLSDQFRNRSQPQHGVDVERFSAGKFEVTRGQYRLFAEATGRSSDGCFIWTGATFEKDQTKDWRNPGYAQDDAHPAACVSWDDASAYVRRLSQKTGEHYRLLTEAEWEYAARGGTTTTRFWGDDGNMSCGYANGADLTTEAQVPGAGNWAVANCNDRHAYTAPVGSYRANSFGLYDMLGNVGEWTQDCWNGNYGGAPTDGSAWAAGDCSLRVVRGGSWDDAPVGLRAAYRVGSPTVIRVYGRGFRVARTD